MDKLAQSKRETGRGWLNQLREKVNMPGAYLEGFFKPELDRVMTSLKILDDKIRSALTGKKIGEADAPEDGSAAKDLIKSARTNFNRREYMSAVSDLGKFHKKMYDITQEINKFFVDVNKIHHKFLFEGLDDKYKGHLEDFRKHMDEVQKKADATNRYFIKEAGIMDFFHNIGSKRGRGLAAWEKKYPKQTKDLREGGDRLINDAQKLLENTISNLKAMATARATRRPDEYMDIANRIKSDYDKFDNGDKGFRAYYNGAIMPWLKIKDEIDGQQKNSVLPTAPVVPVDPTVGKTELGTTPQTLTPTSSNPTLPDMPSSQTIGLTMSPQSVGTVPPLGSGPSASTAPPTISDTSPTVPDAEEVAPDTERKTMIGLGAHKRFYESLESLSQEDPKILAKYIAKYATSIQGTDPNTALQLFTIVKRIKG